MANLERYEYGDAAYVAEIINRSQDTPTYQCDTCGRRFFRKEQLSRHNRNTHGPKVHCMYPDCRYKVATGRAYRLREHLLTHQRKETETKTPLTPKTSTPITITEPDQNQGNTTETTSTATPDTRPKTPLQDLLAEPAFQWRSPQVTITDVGLDYSPSGSIHSLLDFTNMPAWETLMPADPAILDTITNTCTQTSTQTHTDTTESTTQTTTGTSTETTTQTTTGTSTETSTQTTTGTSTETTTQTTTGTSTETGTQTDNNTTDTPVQTDPIKTHHLSADPHYFYIGAPSHYMEGETATLLRQTRIDSLQHTDRYRRRFVPYGYTCMMKRESVTFPDGRVYVLEDCWVRQPVSLRMRESGCQTDNVYVCEERVESEKVQDEPLDLSVRKHEE